MGLYSHTKKRALPCKIFGLEWFFGFSNHFLWEFNLIDEKNEPLSKTRGHMIFLEILSIHIIFKFLK